MTAAAFPPRRLPAMGAGTIDPAVLHLAKYAEITTVGRRTGTPRTTTVCFAWSQHALYVLAHRGPGGRLSDWYRNVIAAGAATVGIGSVLLYAVPAPATDESCARLLVTGLLRHKYGDHAVTTWHPGAAAVPLRLDVVGVAVDPGDLSVESLAPGELLTPVGSP